MRAFWSAALGLLAMLVLWAPSALAQPAGSYLRSCRNMEVHHGRDLSAQCETRRPGDFHATRLADFPTCRGDIANRDGTLWCERRGAPPKPDSNPGLPFRDSCTSIKLKDGIVSAFCRANNGRWHAAILNLATCRPGGEIRNRDGALVCDPRRGFGPPPGSYLRSCRDVATAEGWLGAECRDTRGSWRRTKLLLLPCRGRPDIANRDGQLACP